jgi:hypothetical protein
MGHDLSVVREDHVLGMGTAITDLGALVGLVARRPTCGRPFFVSP